jgi:hypothetical protein
LKRFKFLAKKTKRLASSVFAVCSVPDRFTFEAFQLLSNDCGQSSKETADPLLP